MDVDVGIDRRSPVSWELYRAHGPFRYTGSIVSVRYEPGEPAPDAGLHMIESLRAMAQRFE